MPFFSFLSSPRGPNRLPNDTNFQQQRLAHWQKTPTPKWVMIAFSMIALIFVPIGIAMVTTISTVHQSSVRYDNHPACVNPTTKQPLANCTVELTIDSEMKPPIYVYYQLHNYYQNHRRYVSSYSPYQLHGDDDPDTVDCGPTDSDQYWRYQTFGANEKVTQYPCGAIAGSFFNDSFAATYKPAGSPSSPAIILGGENTDPDLFSWDKNGISYNNDKRERYAINEATLAAVRLNKPNETSFIGRSPAPDFDAPLPLVTNDDFIIWMRNSALDTFRKLYRIIHCVPSENNVCGDSGRKFMPGDVLTFTIANNFDVNRYDGEKRIVVSTTSWAGGRNYFLGAAWITVGGVCLILAALFALITMVTPPVQTGQEIGADIFKVPGGGQLVLPNSPRRN